MIYYCYCSFGHRNTDLWPQDRCKMPAKLVALSLQAPLLCVMSAGSARKSYPSVSRLASRVRLREISSESSNKNRPENKENLLLVLGHL